MKNETTETTETTPEVETTAAETKANLKAAKKATDKKKTEAKTSKKSTKTSEEASAEKPAKKKTSAKGEIFKLLAAACAKGKQPSSVSLERLVACCTKFKADSPMVTGDEKTQRQFASWYISRFKKEHPELLPAEEPATAAAE